MSMKKYEVLTNLLNKVDEQSSVYKSVTHDDLPKVAATMISAKYNALQGASCYLHKAYADCHETLKDTLNYFIAMCNSHEESEAQNEALASVTEQEIYRLSEAEHAACREVYKFCIDFIVNNTDCKIERKIAFYEVGRIACPYNVYKVCTIK